MNECPHIRHVHGRPSYCLLSETALREYQAQIAALSSRLAAVRSAAEGLPCNHFNGKHRKSHCSRCLLLAALQAPPARK